jgi:hypothetical protein
MSDRISSVFVFSYVGSGLATGLITRLSCPINCLQDPKFQINSDGKHASGPNTKRRRRRRRKRR